MCSTPAAYLAGFLVLSQELVFVQCHTALQTTPTGLASDCLLSKTCFSQQLSATTQQQLYAH